MVSVKKLQKLPHTLEARSHEGEQVGDKFSTKYKIIEER
jgi:hypothetical protein